MNNILKLVPLSRTLDKVIDYRGKTPGKLRSDWSTSGYRALSALNVKSSGLQNLDQIKFVDAALYKKWMKEEVKKGDILLTSEAPAGQVLYWDSDEKIVLSQRLFAIRTNTSFDSKYLSYYLKSSFGQKAIFDKMSGSTVFGISAKMFDYIPVILHDLTTQQKISSVLSALDNKIELNNKINTELEVMAKLIYDYWFVQFDFPDENGRPYKSSGGKMVWNEELNREIPEWWRAGGFDSIGEIVGGSTPSRSNNEYFTQNGISWITPKDLSLNSGKKFISKGEIDVTEIGLNSASLKRLPKGSVLLSSRAPIGYIAIARNELTTNQGFKSLIPKNSFSSEFIFHTVQQYINAMIQYASGSTFSEISASTLKMIKIPIPNIDLVRSYTEKVRDIFAQQDILEQENEQFEQLRDWLLPMLMNGQVRVDSVSN